VEITAEMVKELRATTGAGVLDCRKALAATNGDVEKATAYLREKGLAAAAKKAERVANEGLIGLYTDPDRGVAAILELSCETDFVARTDDFKKTAQTLTRQVAETDPKSTDDLLSQQYLGDPAYSVREMLQALIARMGENIVLRRFERFSGHTYGTYVHPGSRVAGIVEIQNGHDSEEFNQLARNLAMQVVAARPEYVSPEGIPVEHLDQQRAKGRQEMASSGKPQNVIERAVEGKLGKWYEETVLLNQPYIRDNTQTVGQLLQQEGNGATISRFARYEVGQ